MVHVAEAAAAAQGGATAAVPSLPTAAAATAEEPQPMLSARSNDAPTSDQIVDFAHELQKSAGKSGAQAFIERFAVSRILRGATFVGHVNTDLDSVCGPPTPVRYASYPWVATVNQGCVASVDGVPRTIARCTPDSAVVEGSERRLTQGWVVGDRDLWNWTAAEMIG